MTLQAVHDDALDTARMMKEHACRRRPTDIAGSIGCYRGDELIAVAEPRQHHRDVLLQLFRACAIGLDADALTMAFEGYVSAVPWPDPSDPDFEEKCREVATNPMTGREWEAGEMSEVAEKHGGIAKGWVSEAVTITSTNRAGDMLMSALPYRYVQRYLVWGEPRAISNSGSAEVSGYMADTMIEAMNETSMGILLPYEPTEGTRAERDAWAVKWMHEMLRCGVILFAGVGQRDRIRVLREAQARR